MGTLHSELDQAPVLPYELMAWQLKNTRVPTVSRLELGGRQKGGRYGGKE